MLPVCVEWLSWCVPPEPWHRERGEEEGMSHPLQSPFTRRTAALQLLAMLAAISPLRSSAQAPPAQDPPAKSDSTAQAPPASPPEANNASEVSTRDNPATFRVRVNLVLVRVVVRDGQGKVITGLRKEDFQLSDNRKPQMISIFSVETPESHKVVPSTPAAPTMESEGEASPNAAAVATLPQRFVAVVFDDTNMAMQDTVFVRDAATRLFGALAPTDRVGMFSTSGQFTQDFTQDHESLKKSLLQIVPRPVGTAGFHDC